MTEEQFKAAKATFPWQQALRTVPHRQGGIVQMIDCNGMEVPLFTMLAFVQAVTGNMAVKRDAAAPVTPA